MVSPELLEQAESYLEWRCLDKKWFERREKLGKPINLRNLKMYKESVECFKENGTYTAEREQSLFEEIKKHVRDVQNGYAEGKMGHSLPITDEERAKTLETHRNYFANYLFDLMEEKNFSEAEIAAKARVDIAIFDKLRHERRYTPEERTIWALALALELSFGETNSLLKRAPYMSAGNYCLSANITEEVLITFFLDKEIYDLSLADEILTHYGCKTLEIKEDFSKSTDEKPFRDENLIERLDLYIDKNFNDPAYAKKDNAKYSISYGKSAEPTGYLKTFEIIVRKVKNAVGLAGSYFSDNLFKLIKQKNLTEVEVYKAAHLDRRIFSKIRNGVNYMPSKKTVLAIAVAMKLDLTETNTLLSCAGYFLSNGRKEDVIVRYFIENEIYDLYLINEVLEHYGCPILGD